MKPLHAVLLNGPEKLLTAVIEIERHGCLVDADADRLRRGNLDLLDEIFVITGRYAPTLIRVQIDIVSEHLEPGYFHRRHVLTQVRRSIARPPELLERTEIQNNAHGVRLKRNEGQGGTNKLTKPEQERNGDCNRLSRKTNRWWLRWPVPDHLVVALVLTAVERELVPDEHPLSGLLVKFALTDLYADVANEGVADGVYPIIFWNAREIDFDKERGEEIGVAGNDGTDLITEGDVALEIDGNGFYGEWRIPLL